MYCINCGTKLPDGAKFCFECGSPVNVASVEDDEYSIKTSTANEIQNAETEDWITPLLLMTYHQMARVILKYTGVLDFKTAEVTTLFCL